MDTIRAFLSYNKADRGAAHALAQALLSLGAVVWYDEWEIGPGASILAGMEKGLTDSNMLLLLWSRHAAASNWVDTELRAFLRRRVEDGGLRVVPVMLDATPLPTLVADYRGCRLNTGSDIPMAALEICGRPSNKQVVKLLHTRLLETLHGHKELAKQPLAIFCDECYSTKLRHGTSTDEERDDTYYYVVCEECGWSDATEI